MATNEPSESDGPQQETTETGSTADGTVDQASARAYIQGLLEVSASDARNNAVVAAAEVATILFLVKDSIARIQNAGLVLEWIAAITVFALAVSAGLFFYYSARINQVRMNIVRALSKNDAQAAWNHWVSKTEGVQAKYGKWQKSAVVFLVVGVLGVVTVVIGLLFFTSTPPSLP